MAHVLTYWWHPLEEESFVDFLLSTGPIVGMSFGKGRRRDELAPLPICDLLRSEPEQLFFTAQELVDDIVVELYDIEGGFYRISDMKSCVIGYDRARFKEPGLVLPANLYYYTRYPNETATDFIDKPKAFVGWAKRVFTWVYKATPKTVNGKRLSERLLEAVTDGKMELADY